MTEVGRCFAGCWQSMAHPTGVQVAHGSSQVQRNGASVAVPLQLPELVRGKGTGQVSACTTRDSS